MFNYLTENYNPYNAYYNWSYYPYFYNAQINQNQKISPFFSSYNVQNAMPKQNSAPVNISFCASQQMQAKQNEKLSTGTKWGIGIGLASLATIGIYLASKGKAKPNNQTTSNFIENIKKIILPENIKPQQFSSKEEAINFAKNTLKINKIDEKMSLDALNDSINAIIKISNKHKGQLFMPPELRFVQGNGDFIAEVTTSIAKQDFGTLKINSSLYNISELDSMLQSDKWKKYLFTNDGVPLFHYQNGKLVNNPTFNYITMRPDSNLSDLLQKYYRNESMTLKEKQNLLLSMSSILDNATRVKSAPLSILEKIQKQHSDFLNKNGIKIDLKSLSKKSISEQSQELSNILEKLVNNKRFVDTNCSVKTIEDTIFHEFGHLQDIGVNKELVSNATENANRFSTKKYFEEVLLPKYPDLKLPSFITDSAEQNTAGQVSGYATSSIGEFIAETYTKIIKGEKLSNDVMALYKKYNGPIV